MLTNYDAKAVAGVMGLAFTLGPAETAGAGGCVIQVDDATLCVVESRAGGRGAPRGQRLSPPTSLSIEKAVEQGLPRAALRHVAAWLAGGDTSRIAELEWGVVPKTTLERRGGLLSRQESERTERIARLAVHARRALGTEAEARTFMTTPHPELDGRSPVDAARSDLGTRRVEQVLNALEYGLAV